MKFVVEGTQASDVTFRAEVDDDGDLMLYANGHKLLFITHGGGRLARMGMTDDQRAALAGFSFDGDDRIEVSV